MTGEATIIGIKKQILRSLKELYPVKVDEIVLISAVEESNKYWSINQISETIRSMIVEGLIEESFVRGPVGKTEIRRFKITPFGIEHLRSMESMGNKTEAMTTEEIESRLEQASDGLKANMESMRKGLEESIEDVKRKVMELSEEVAAIRMILDQYKNQTEGEKAREERLILQILPDNERTIYNAILNAGGQMLQKDLVTITRMSNAKISRTIDHLESRGILTRERHGATNRLKIIIKPPKT